MSKMKNWMMDMDELIYDAIESGATNANSVFCHVSTQMFPVDQKYIEKKTLEMMGPEGPDF